MLDCPFQSAFVSHSGTRGLVGLRPSRLQRLFTCLTEHTWHRGMLRRVCPRGVLLVFLRSHDSDVLVGYEQIDYLDG